jgi:hypothetical protein
VTLSIIVTRITLALRIRALATCSSLFAPGKMKIQFLSTAINFYRPVDQAKPSEGRETKGTERRVQGGP